MRSVAFALLPLLGLLAGCEVPPAESLAVQSLNAKPLDAGTNSAGEACQYELTKGGAVIYCAKFDVPSGEVRRAGAGADIAATATRLRADLKRKAECDDPRPVSIPYAQAALAMSCVDRGSFPSVAIAVQVGDGMWVGDGIAPVAPVLERVIAKLSGREPPGQPTPGIEGLAAKRVAARTFNSSDYNDFEANMRIGRDANLANQPAEAEAAYTRALKIQDRILPHDVPGKAAPVMSIALQKSNQGQFALADKEFSRADELTKPSTDSNLLGRLRLYHGLHALNQGDTAGALAWFDAAEQEFRIGAPDIREEPPPAPQRSFFTVSAGRSFSDALGDAEPYQLASETEALLGILEVRRNRAIALRLADKPAESEVAARSADQFAMANHLVDTPYSKRSARLFRTFAMTDAAAGQLDMAVDESNSSALAFSQALPGTPAAAESELARAVLLTRKGRTLEALGACRSAIATLRSQSGDGVSAERLAPCLAAFAASPEAGEAPRVEMFEAAQLVRSSLTTRQIQEAAAELAAGARDPKVASAIRNQRDTNRKYRQAVEDRNNLQTRGATAADIEAADKVVAEAETAREAAERVIQADAPNYDQLITPVVTAQQVFTALGPGGKEAFVSFVLTRDGGWTFCLRDQHVSVAPIAGGSDRVTALVKRLRAGVTIGADGNLPSFDIAASRELYTALFGGLGDALDGVQSVTIAPTGPLLAIPFAILLTGPADGADLGAAPWLVRKFAMEHVPAAANFTKLRQTPPSSARNPWFGFGDFHRITPAQAIATYPTPACRQSATDLADLPTLDGSRAELQYVAGIMNAGPNDMLLGAAFTVPAVQATPLKDYRVIHFATHGLLPAELGCQDQPAIITSAPAGARDASGALLTAEAVFGLKMDADLVIISACNTGGPDGKTAGEGLAGLARSFFYAGARSMLVSHWDVSELAAGRLIGGTLTNYTTSPGKGLAAALRDAELAWIDNPRISPAQKHPIYWAPFALVGDSHQAAGPAASAASAGTVAAR